MVKASILRKASNAEENKIILLETGVQEEDILSRNQLKTVSVDKEQYPESAEELVIPILNVRDDAVNILHQLRCLKTRCNKLLRMIMKGMEEK